MSPGSWRNLRFSGQLNQQDGAIVFGDLWMVAIRHSSNAFLHMPNRGENMWLVDVTF